jgi:hypothetical protein
MEHAERKDFRKPDEVREFPKGKVELDCHPGDVSLLPSGHDAWVVGNEPAVVVDFQGMIDYARTR